VASFQKKLLSVLTILVNNHSNTQSSCLPCFNKNGHTNKPENEKFSVITN
jgi:hypothetical protein